MRTKVRANQQFKNMSWIQHRFFWRLFKTNLRKNIFTKVCFFMNTVFIFLSMHFGRRPERKWLCQGSLHKPITKEEPWVHARPPLAGSMKWVLPITKHTQHHCWWSYKVLDMASSIWHLAERQFNILKEGARYQSITHSSSVESEVRLWRSC